MVRQSGSQMLLRFAVKDVTALCEVLAIRVPAGCGWQAAAGWHRLAGCLAGWLGVADCQTGRSCCLRFHRLGHARQEEFNADFNANVNADGMLQDAPTPKVQRQREAVSAPMGGLQSPTPKGACHTTASRLPPLMKELTFHRFQRQWQIPTAITFHA